MLEPANEKSQELEIFSRNPSGTNVYIPAVFANVVAAALDDSLGRFLKAHCLSGSHSDTDSKKLNAYNENCEHTSSYFNPLPNQSSVGREQERPTAFSAALRSMTSIVASIACPIIKLEKGSSASRPKADIRSALPHVH